MTSNNLFNAVMAIDLDPIKMKLMHVESGEGWSQRKADAVEKEYRRFLCIMKMYPNEDTAPQVDVDTFWHYHILDTMKYAEDCTQAFGYFLHHYPYVGMRGGEDEQFRMDSGERMRTLYETTFNEAYLPLQAEPVVEPSFDSSGVYLETSISKTAGIAADVAFCAGPGAQAAFCAGPGSKKIVASKHAVVADTAFCAGPGAKAAFCAGPGVKKVDANKHAVVVDTAFCAGPGSKKVVASKHPVAPHTAFCAGPGSKKAVASKHVAVADTAFCAGPGKVNDSRGLKHGLLEVSLNSLAA